MADAPDNAPTLVLGETKGHLDCATPERANAVIAELIGQAQRSIMLLAATLEMPVFMSRDTETRLAQFVSRHPQNRAKFLIGDEVLFVRHNPRLVELCRRFPTYLQVRLLTPEYLPPDEMFVVADGVGYFRKSAGKPPIRAHLNSRAEAQPLASRFKELWEFGGYVSELHPLGL